jgi:hypothetical protein
MYIGMLRDARSRGSCVCGGGRREGSTVRSKAALDARSPSFLSFPSLPFPPPSTQPRGRGWQPHELPRPNDRRASARRSRETEGQRMAVDSVSRWSSLQHRPAPRGMCISCAGRAPPPRTRQGRRQGIRQGIRQGQPGRSSRGERVRGER